MRKKQVYLKEKNGSIHSYKSIKECIQEIGICKGTFYNHRSISEPIKNTWFIGYDKDEVEVRAKEYWGETKSIDNKQVQLLVELVSKQQEKLETYEKKFSKMEQKIESLQTNKPTIPVYTETKQESITQPIVTQELKQKDKVEAKKEVSKPIEQQTTMSVNANNVGEIVPYSSIPKPSEEPYKVLKKNEKKDSALWKWTNETFKVWYRNPIDKNFHFCYCPGYDLQDEWNVSDCRPYCYLPNGEMFDYRDRDKDEEHRQKWAIITDEKNGCKKWLEERNKLASFFKKNFNRTKRRVGFTIDNETQYPQPVCETTQYEGVYKIYDCADLFLMRKSICNNFLGSELTLTGCIVPENNILYRTYKELKQYNTGFVYVSELCQEDKKLFSEIAGGLNPSTIPLNEENGENYMFAKAKQLNDKIEKAYEDEFEIEI